MTNKIQRNANKYIKKTAYDQIDSFTKLLYQ